MNVTSAKRRQKLQGQGKPVNGKTGTDGIMAAYGNKRQRQAAAMREQIAQAKK